MLREVDLIVDSRVGTHIMVREADLRLEGVFSIDLIFQCLKILLLYLKILVHLIKLCVFLLDFLLILNLPFFDLLSPSFKGFGRDPVI